jgi:hypothetical protein
LFTAVPFALWFDKSTGEYWFGKCWTHYFLINDAIAIKSATKIVEVNAPLMRFVRQRGEAGVLSSLYQCCYYFPRYAKRPLPKDSGRLIQHPALN